MKSNYQIRLVTLILVLFLASAISSPVWAQATGIKGFNLYYFAPSFTPGEFSFTETAHTRGKKKIIAKIAQSIAYRQIFKLGTATGDRDLVKTLVTTDHIIGYGITNWLDVGVDLPVHYFSQGQNVATGATYKTASLGDVRVMAKINIVKQNDDDERPAVSLLIHSTLPTGNEFKFLGTGQPVPGFDLLISRRVQRLLMSLNLGYELFPKKIINGVTFDDRIRYSIGAAAKLSKNKHWWLASEIAGQFQTHDFRTSTSPAMLDLTLTKHFKRHFIASLGGGVSLNNAIGNPNVVGMLTLSKVWVLTSR